MWCLHSFLLQTCKKLSSGKQDNVTPWEKGSSLLSSSINTINVHRKGARTSSFPFESIVWCSHITYFQTATCNLGLRPFTWTLPRALAGDVPHQKVTVCVHGTSQEVFWPCSWASLARDISNQEVPARALGTSQKLAHRWALNSHFFLAAHTSCFPLRALKLSVAVLSSQQSWLPNRHE